MTPVAHVSHQVAGRARIKVPDRRRDDGYFAQLGERLASCPGVVRVEVNAITASALIVHDTDLASLAAWAETNALFALREDAANAPTLALSLARQGEVLDTALRTGSGGTLDLASLGFALLMGLALFQMTQGEVLAPAATLAWYAVTLLIMRARPATDIS
jgi:hypothetical protein